MEALPLPPVCGCGHYTVRDRVPQQSARRGTIMNSLTHAEVNHAPGSYVSLWGFCMGRISTWRTEQLVNSSRRYVSATPVRRLSSQELVETTIF